MDWLALLSQQRLGVDSGKRQHSRTDFERDYDRVLFSSPFRRLRDKTQVFPLPENDHIHNRLTHSLEVASVGRSLGKMVGRTVIERHAALQDGYHHSDFGDIVAAACMAHDIGNPPFGHSGEEAIARWFCLDSNQAYLADLDAAQRRDLQQFEGNAQGFRVISRTSMYANEGGMRLTYATLGTFSKYPQGSLDAGCKDVVAGKKFGFFQAEQEIFADLATTLGLPLRQGNASWLRHPLAYLMEGADDICYTILDAEDGYALGHFSFADVCDLLRPIARVDEMDPRASRREQVSRLRAHAIAHLVDQVVEQFLEHEDMLLAGTYDQSLIDNIPDAVHIDAIKERSTAACYNAPEVLHILMSGHRVIGELLDLFVPAALCRDKSKRERQICLLLPPELAEAQNDYERLLCITDYISGMTDRYAMNLYRSLGGIAMPSMAAVRQ